MLEMSPAHGVIPNAVPVALEPHPACVQGRQGFLGVEQRLALQGNFDDVMRRCTAGPCATAPGCTEGLWSPRIIGDTCRTS